MPKPRRKTDEQRQSRKIRRRGDPVADRAKELGVSHQAANDSFGLTDIVNNTDADHRDMVRLIGYDTEEAAKNKTKTIRRLTRIEKLWKRGVIDQRELAACEWYSRAHAARYDTCGITAKYGESNGAANTNFDHLPKTKLQWDALAHYDMAREAISPMVRPMFDRIVLEGRPLGKLAITFRNAARRLLEHIEGKVAL